MFKTTRKNEIYRVIFFVVLAVGFFGMAGPSHAGHMFLEYRGALSDEYSYYRGAFDLGDLNHDGMDEMVIADDEGGFHVYKYTPAGFVPMWISAPLIDDGYIVEIEIKHEDVIGFHPIILLLDSVGTLHQITYTGYLFEETATYDDYRIPDETGRLVLTDTDSGETSVIIAIPGENEVNGTGQSDGGASNTDQWAGMALYRLTSEGMIELTAEEIASLDEGQVYFVRELSVSEIDQLQAIGSGEGRFFSGDNNQFGRAGIADLDADALVELLVSVSDPDRPIDHLEIYSEEGGLFTVKVTLELPLINEMVLGDVDGDGFSEIVGLTFDGDVLVYQYDPLTVMLANGTEIDWETPHQKVNNTIWMSIGAFEALGCTAVEHPDSLEITFNNHSVILDREAGSVMCGDEVLVPQVPEGVLDSAPFLPFFSALDCLGFNYTYDPSKNLVEME
ncbi:MAG: hypothetical protein NTY09_05070 [bacterium]|nr:hypothetical protein [bacterium]